MAYPHLSGKPWTTSVNAVHLRATHALHGGVPVGSRLQLPGLLQLAQQCAHTGVAGQ